MTAEKRSRFSMSGDTNKIEVKKPQATAPAPEGRTKPKPKSDKQMTLLDLVQIRLHPENFEPGTVVKVMEPYFPKQEYFKVAATLVRDATRIAQRGGSEQSFTAAQLVMIQDSMDTLSVTLIEMITTASTLEWASALSAMCLRHMLDNPSEAEADKTKRVYSHMMDLMNKYADSNGDNNG